MRIVPVLIVAGLAAGCGTGPTSTTGVTNAPTTAPTTTSPTHQAATTAGATSTTTQPAATVAAASTTSTTQLTPSPATMEQATPSIAERTVPGGETPIDLRDATPVPAPPHIDHDEPDVVGIDLAIAWVMERYTARSDEPPADRRSRLAALTSASILVESSPPAPALEAGTATWPIDVAAEHVGGNDWAVNFTLNQTPITGPLEQHGVIVTIANGRVLGERSQ